MHVFKNMKSLFLRNSNYPIKVTEIWSFLGLVGYYCRIVKRFSNIAAPFAKLTKNSVKFVWVSNCEKGFVELKCQPIIAPILTIPSGTERYAVYNDASHQGLGCVLMQYKNVIAYGSRQLKNHIGLVTVVNRLVTQIRSKCTYTYPHLDRFQIIHPWVGFTTDPIESQSHTHIFLLDLWLNKYGFWSFLQTTLSPKVWSPIHMHFLLILYLLSYFHFNFIIT